MPKKKDKNAKFEKKFLEGLEVVKTPVRNSIFIALSWTIAIMIIVILASYANGMSLSWNLNFGASIGIVISILWLLLKIGVGEGATYKFFNWKNKKVLKQINSKNKSKLTIEEYRNLNKQKSFVGIILLFSISLLAMIITLMIIYI